MTKENTTHSEKDSATEFGHVGITNGPCFSSSFGFLCRLKLIYPTLFTNWPPFLSIMCMMVRLIPPYLSFHMVKQC